VSTPKQRISVTRTYRHEPDNCARALELLLKKSVNKMAAEPAQPDGRDDVRKGQDAHTATQNCT
jgi:hypothetical protein